MDYVTRYSIWMRKRCLFPIFFALLCAQPVWAANWVPVGQSDAGVYYLDRASVISSGNIRRAWTMLDYRQPQTNKQNKTYLSSRTMMEFDCDKEFVRPRSFSLHAHNQLKGEVLTSEGIVQGWQAAPPETPIFKMLITACEK